MAGKPYLGPMTWQVYLQGAQVDLDALARMFSTGPLHVAQSDSGTYLAGDELDAPADVSGAYNKAKERLALINGAAGSLAPQSYQPVDVLNVRDDDTNTTYAMAQATLTTRSTMFALATVMGPDGRPVPAPPPAGPDLIKWAMTDPDLAKAIEWMGRPTETNWHDLWKAFEVLRHAAGGNRPFAARFGLNQADLLSFRSSANDPETSGDHARHVGQ